MLPPTAKSLPVSLSVTGSTWSSWLPTSPSRRRRRSTSTTSASPSSRPLSKGVLDFFFNAFNDAIRAKDPSSSGFNIFSRDWGWIPFNEQTLIQLTDQLGQLAEFSAAKFIRRLVLFLAIKATKVVVKVPFSILYLSCCCCCCYYYYWLWNIISA